MTASSSNHPERLDVRLGGTFKFLMGCGGVMSLGVVPLALWFSARSWPRVIDAEGITLRSGRRVRFDEFTRAMPVTVVNQNGQRITGRLDLEFGSARVKIVPQSLANGWEVMQQLSQRLGIPLETG